MTLKLYFSLDTFNLFVNPTVNSSTHIVIIQEKCMDFGIGLVNEDKQAPRSKIMTLNHTGVCSVIYVITVIIVLAAILLDLFSSVVRLH
jgi:hypothetical protein